MNYVEYCPYDLSRFLVSHRFDYCEFRRRVDSDQWIFVPLMTNLEWAVVDMENMKRDWYLLDSI